MPVQPRTPPGVLELLPHEQLEHQRMLDTIRRGYERFGYLPVETPAFELTSVLLTKSGGETEKQVYYVQSSGALKQGEGEGKQPELALRFDLTVPLARYVAQHEHALNFPFRRYQIQRVYRGERNQKGRYREFYQCDIDVIGKDALPLAYDAEIPAIIHGIFRELAFGAFTIRINNRKLLRGILETVGVPAEQHTSVLHEVDRLGKQPRAEIEARIAGEAAGGVGPDVAKRLLDTLAAHAGNSAATLAQLADFAAPSPAFTEGLAELREVYDGTLALGVPAEQCVIDLSIVRGLDYYTGTVYETFLDEHPKLGSICSGGRYENLAGHYTKSKLPGVGISIGATRLFSQLREMKLVGVKRQTVSQVVLLNLEADLRGEIAAIARELRAAGFNAEVYGGLDKFAKQLKYADQSGAPFALFCGARERDAGMVKLKDFRVTTERAPEIEVPRADVVDRLRSLLGAG